MKKSQGKKSRVRTEDAAGTSRGSEAGMPKQSPVRSDSGSPTAPASPVTSGEPTVTSMPILLAHATWYLIGPLFLLITLLCIVRAGTGWATVLDVLFFVGVAAMFVARWADQRSGQGTTMSGEPSTWEDFRRYAIRLPLVAIALWIVANMLGNHWFQGNAGF